MKVFNWQLRALALVSAAVLLAGALAPGWCLLTLRREAAGVLTL